MPYFEIGWVRDDKRLTYITPNITDLVGWTIEEINAMTNAHDVLVHPDHAHATQALMKGEPGTIQAHTMDLALRHKDGHDVSVQSTIICRYDGSGDLAEMWGATHPADGQHAHMAAWWKQTDPAYHRAALDMVALYPATA